MHRHARTVQHPPRTPGAAFTAIAFTVLWHGALSSWLWTLQVRVRDASNAAPSSDAIDIVFVPRRTADVRPADNAEPPAARNASASARVAHAATSEPTEPGPAPEPEPRPDPTADGVDVVTGDDRWSPSSSPHVVVPPRNPLARVDRHALDVAPRLQVRMRPPRSVEAWLKVLAPAGYEADPCPGIARAIAGLASDGAAESRALLDDAVAFEARYCR